MEGDGSSDSPSEHEARSDGAWYGKRGSRDASLSDDESDHLPQLKKAKFPWQVKNLKRKQLSSVRKSTHQDVNLGKSSDSNSFCSEQSCSDTNCSSAIIMNSSDESWRTNFNLDGASVRHADSSSTPKQSDSHVMMNPELCAEIARIESILPDGTGWQDAPVPCEDPSDNTEDSTRNQEDDCSDVDSESIGHCSEASADGSLGEDATDESGAPSMLSRWRRTYCEQWQIKHMVNAIVENAINRTLEDVGLGPGSPSNELLESRGVAAAIHAQGLRAPNAPSLPPDRTARLNPLISRLTEVSESLFSETMEVAMSPITSQYHGHLAGFPGTSQMTVDQRVHLPLTDSPFLPRPMDPQNLCNDRLSSTCHAEKSPNDQCTKTPNKSNPTAHTTYTKGTMNKTSDEMEEVHYTHQISSCSSAQTTTSASPVPDSCMSEIKATCNSSELCDSVDTVAEPRGEAIELSTHRDELYNLDAPSLCTVDIINQAVTAAISEKGLALNSVSPL